MGGGRYENMLGVGTKRTIKPGGGGKTMYYSTCVSCKELKFVVGEGIKNN